MVLAHITIKVNKAYYLHRHPALFSTSSASTLRSSKPSSKQQYLFTYLFLKGREAEHVSD